VDELRDLLANKTRFDLNAADAFVDRLGSATGQDVHGGLRLVASLVLTNESFGHVYERVTDSFRMATTRLRDEAAAYNFSNGLAVIMPALGLPANQTLSIVQYARNPYEGLSVAPINSSVISIMVADMVTGNETKVSDLDTLLNFTLPVAGQGETTCVYWNGTEWSGDGCRLLALTDAAATCGCNHLTDFALIVEPVASPTPSQSHPTWQPSTGPHFILAAGTPTQAAETNIALIVGLAVGGTFAVTLAAALIIANIKHSRSRKVKHLSQVHERWAYPPSIIVKK
jgi:hypothetical protein